MKKFLVILILILTFQTPSQANDIRDFQIEGVGIGDSLLDFYSSEEIELRVSRTTSHYKSDKFIRTNFKSGFGSKKFEIYDGIGVHFKKKDSIYKLHALSGYFLIYNKSECIKKHDEIVKDLSKTFTSKPEYDTWENESGETVTSHFFLDNGEIIVRCSIWNEETMKKNNWSRNLRVVITSSEFIKWWKTEAYP